MAIVKRFNVNREQATLDAEIIENMSANDVSYNSSLQYDENTVGDKFSELDYKLIKFKWMGTHGEILHPGEYAYRTDTKVIRKCTVGTTVIDVPFYSGAIYQYNNEFYIWNGEDLMKYNNPIIEHIDNGLLDLELRTRRNFPLEIETGGISFSDVDQGLPKESDIRARTVDFVYPPFSIEVNSDYSIYFLFKYDLYATNGNTKSVEKVEVSNSVLNIVDTSYKYKLSFKKTDGSVITEDDTSLIIKSYKYNNESDKNSELYDNYFYNFNEGFIAKQHKSLSFTDGEYISLKASVGDVISLTPMTYSETTYAISDCQEGDIISAKGGFAATGARLVGFVDSSNVLLFVTEFGTREGTFVAPSGTAKCIVNGLINQTSAVLYTNVEIANWKSSVEDLYEKVIPLDKKVIRHFDLFTIPINGVDKYINVAVSVGEEVSLTPINQDGFRYSIYDCTEGDIFTINGNGGGMLARLWAFIDSENKLISKASASVEAHNLKLYAPTNAAKIIINSNVDGINTFKSKDNIYDYIENMIGVNTDAYYSKETINAFATYQSLIAVYDELVTRYPYCVTKRTLGTNSLDTPIYEYKFSFGSYNQEGVRGMRDEVKDKPKFLLITGTHGYERASIAATYLFVKELVEGDKFLQNILGCVDLRVIPCLCPYGLDNNSRTNENNVNINRNFTRGWVLQGEGTNDYSGPSASSEKETQIVEAWVRENSDAKFFIDYHNSGFVNEMSCLVTYSNTTENCENFKNTYLTSVASIISNLIGLRGVSSDSIFEYTSVDTAAGMSHGLGDELGMPSAYLETSWNVIGNGINDSASISVGADILGNIMNGFYKLFVE